MIFSLFYRKNRNANFRRPKRKENKFVSTQKTCSTIITIEIEFFLFYFFRRNILNKYEMKKINFKVDVT